MSINGDAIFKRLLRLIHLPELADDPRYRTNKERAENSAELDALIDNWTKQYPLREVLHHLEEASIPAGPICSIALYCSS